MGDTLDCPCIQESEAEVRSLKLKLRSLKLKLRSRKLKLRIFAGSVTGHTDSWDLPMASTHKVCQTA